MEQQEPSMEEILSSIRRILSHESTDGLHDTDNAAVTVSQPVLENIAEAEVMELTDDMRVDEKSESPVETSVPEDMVLLSEAAVQVSTDKLNHLMNQVSASQGKPSEPQDVNSSLESLVLSLLRPYLKEWLNANLPTLVERLVQKEVERLVKNVKLS